MSLEKKLQKVADKLRNLSIDLGDVKQVDKEGFSHTLQRTPMFSDQEIEKYKDDKNKNPERLRAVLVVKQMEETLKTIR